MTTTLLPNIANQTIDNKGRFNAAADLGAIIQATVEDKPFDNMVKAKAPEKAELPEKPEKDYGRKHAQNHAQNHAMALRTAKYSKTAEQNTDKPNIAADTPKATNNIDLSEKIDKPIEADPNKVVIEVPNQVGYSVETLRNLLADGLQEADVAPLEQLQLNPTQDPTLNPALSALQSLVKEILAQAEQGTLKLDPKLQAVFAQLTGAKTDSDVLQALNGIFKLFSARFQESNPGQAIKQFVAKLELKLPPELLAKLADVPMLRTFAKKDVLTGQDLNRAMRTLVGLSLQDQTNAADYSLEALAPQPKTIPNTIDSIVLNTLTQIPSTDVPAVEIAGQAAAVATPLRPTLDKNVGNDKAANYDANNAQIIIDRGPTNRPTDNSAITANYDAASAKNTSANNKQSIHVDNSTLKTLASTAKESTFVANLDSNHPIAASKLESHATQSLKLSATQNALPSPATAQVAMYVQRAAGKVQQMTVQLNPAELGRVDIKMVAKPDGTTQVVLQVERPDTFMQLQKDTTHLEKMLQQAGLNTSAGDLSFQLKNQDQADQQAFGKQGQKHSSHGANNAVGTDIANEITEIDSSTLNLALGLRRVDYSA